MARLLLCALCVILGICSFIVGFFPSNSPLTGQSTFEGLPTIGNCTIKDAWSRRMIGQVVFIVIDALRLDFVFSREQLKTVGPQWTHDKPKLEKVKRLLDQDVDAVGFVAQAHPPTVTLPRIKALTTGDIPGFVDVVLNFGSSRLTGDNLISQLVQDGWRINFFGDDTWLKLFPNLFETCDGTTSFFVSDFTEVDVNVSRHITHGYLSNSDWDMTILHFLGLDHIGHVAGPTSPLIKPKLDEMDDLIMKIKNELFMKHSGQNGTGLPPLILVMGDHGMADAGGHGGSSPAETHVPFIVISPEVGVKSAKKRGGALIKQPDVVPTLSRLCGVPIPMNNIGVIIESIVAAFETKSKDCPDRLMTSFYNALQVSKSLERNIKTFDEDPGYQRFRNLVKDANGNSLLEIERLAKELYLVTEMMSQSLENNKLQYKVGLMLAGITILILVFISLLFWVVNVQKLPWMLLLHALHIVSLGSTSFIEEEHQSVYFFGATAMVLMVFGYLKREKIAISTNAEFIRNNIVRGVCILIVLRIARCWNQTGDKWAHLPDVSDWLVEPRNRLFLTLLHIMALLLTGTLVIKRYGREARCLEYFTHGCSLFLVYFQKVSDGSVSNIFEKFFEVPVTRTFWPSQLIYIVAIASFFINFKRKNQVRALEPILPVLMLLAQPQSSILIPAALFVESCFGQSPGYLDAFSPFDLSLLYYLLGKIMFFHMGNSNSLSSVNVGAGYNGVPDYVPSAIGLLLALNTFSGQLLWLCLLCERVPKKHLSECYLSYSFRFCCELIAFCIVCLLCRYHLFVWTVFAPKIMFEAMEAITVNLYFLLIYFSTKQY